MQGWSPEVRLGLRQRQYRRPELRRVWPAVHQRCGVCQRRLQVTVHHLSDGSGALQRAVC